MEVCTRVPTSSMSLSTHSCHYRSGSFRSITDIAGLVQLRREFREYRNSAHLQSLSADGGEAMPRELIDTETDKRYVRRDEKGQFKESDDVGRSHAQDQKRHSNTKPKKGEGDKGDR